jgi:response regulator NasT
LDNALIVSYSEKSIGFFTEMLNAVSCNLVMSVKTCGEARRLLVERGFDLCIINAPLLDESGEALSKYIASKGNGQVIIVVKNEYYEDISGIVEDYGVITVAKPLNRALFWSALKMAKAAQSRLRMMQDENAKLMKKIEDIRIVDRAKCVLIAGLNMDEEKAHRYLEKQAMDLRLTKREVAERILNGEKGIY